MPWIERIEVEDGFLDGLDLALSPGLNVVIGARGTGKTSLLELLRFVLGAPAFTEQAAALGKAQVEAILGRGRVTATIRHDGGEVETVSRTVGSLAAAGLAATVLAQNEIEAVGASARGRLHLIDRFIEQSRTSEMDRLVAEIAAAARSVDAGREEIESLRERISEIAAVEVELLQLRSEQEEAFERASATEADRQKLDELQRGLQKSAMRVQLLDQATEALRDLRRALNAAKEASSFPGWPDEAGEDPTVAARSTFGSVLDTVDDARRAVEGALAEVEEATTTDATARRQGEDEARDLRRQLGAMDAEISQLASRIAELNERLGHLRGLEEKLRERERQMLEASQHRDALFNALDDLREERHHRRAREVQRLNDNLRGAIQVELGGC